MCTCCICVHVLAACVSVPSQNALSHHWNKTTISFIIFEFLSYILYRGENSIQHFVDSIVCLSHIVAEIKVSLQTKFPTGPCCLWWRRLYPRIPPPFLRSPPFLHPLASSFSSCLSASSLAMLFVTWLVSARHLPQIVPLISVNLYTISSHYNQENVCVFVCVGGRESWCVRAHTYDCACTCVCLSQMPLHLSTCQRSQGSQVSQVKRLWCCVDSQHPKNFG